MGSVYLSIPIVAEVIATSALKASNEFTKLGPSLVVVVGYGVAFYCLALVMRTIPVGVAYAIWAGVGIVLISIIGVVVFERPLDLPAMIGIVLIMAGVVIINLYSQAAVH